MHIRILAFVLAGVPCAFGQLTMDQKISDFQEVAGQYAKQYGPHDWKKLAFGIDLFDTAKWLDKVRATKTDLEFYDVMAEWVAQLNDAHDGYQNPSNFSADLGFNVDVYDGKLLVDSVNRTRLSAYQYPIAIGYELVSIDGKEANALVNSFLRYGVAANDRSTRRAAAQFLTSRRQSIIPSAGAVPDVSTVVFRRFDGKLETYQIPWYKIGLPLVSVGKFPGYTQSHAAAEAEADPYAAAETLLARATNFRLTDRFSIQGLGSLTPVFVNSLPASFVQRLGRTFTDPFFSGTFTAGAYRIGYIRIPSFAPLDLNGAVTAFAREIAFFQDNTDGLVIDITRNPGGSGSYTQALLNYLMFYPYRTLGLELRATSNWILSFSSAYESLKAAGAPPPVLQPYKDVLDALIEANQTNRGLTKAVPWDFGPSLDRQPLRDNTGNMVAYNRPVMILTDEFSASAADAFAAVIQDNGRAPLFGWRTMGAGGNVGSTLAGSYSFGQVSLTQSLMNRAWERAEEGGYPVNRYVENVGVHPEIRFDYMTRDNLLQGGKLFVDAFVSAMTDHIRKNR